MQASGLTTIELKTLLTQEMGEYIANPDITVVVNSMGSKRAFVIGEVRGNERSGSGKPLEGVRVLAIEQMQALPYGTQLMAHLGADVVKVEHPEHGDSGRGAQPRIRDADGRQVGATYLRNNLNKRSMARDSGLRS